jgi:voltage-gated potassium channel
MNESARVRQAEPGLTRRQLRRQLLLTLLRSSLVAALLVGLFYAAPFKQLDGVPVFISLPIELLIFSAVVTWQVLAIIRAPYPGIRAVEGLAVTVPLFLVMFAAAYMVLAQDNPTNFSTASLTRTDSLYFTITVFSTVGFGDITATSQTARVLVMIQMLLDLVILGLGVHLLVGAVNLGRQRRTDEGTKSDVDDGAPR